MSDSGGGADPNDLHRRILASSLPPKMPGGMRAGMRRSSLQRDYSPIAWSQFFETKNTLDIQGRGRFNMYSSGHEGPILVVLHGGGFSGLSWCCFAKDIREKVKCRVWAPDIRGHGNTETSDDNDLSADTLTGDVVATIKRKLEEDGVNDRPPFVLMGHSMGGALAVHAALTKEIDNIVGVCVIDVVEGTAMDALSSMQTFLRSRPSHFMSLAYAIEWSVRSGQVRNVESSRVSMPGQLKSISSGKCGTYDVGKKLGMDDDKDGPNSLAAEKPHPKLRTADSIEEEVEDPDGKLHEPEEAPAKGETHSGYTWRIDLAETEPHWAGWFSGLSEKFLSVPASKLLLLAGVDRLDRELTVGQMQGKFQMQVLPAVGHAVHEDAPDKVADVLATFLVRNKFAEPLEEFPRTFPGC